MTRPKMSSSIVWSSSIYKDAIMKRRYRVLRGTFWRLMRGGSLLHHYMGWRLSPDAWRFLRRRKRVRDVKK